MYKTPTSARRRGFRGKRGHLPKIVPNWGSTQKWVGRSDTTRVNPPAAEADARVVKSMAKKSPEAANDPAALAFSAVEDALKDSIFNSDSPQESEPTQAP